jgi:hypothetical protein
MNDNEETGEYIKTIDHGTIQASKKESEIRIMTSNINYMLYIFILYVIVIIVYIITTFDINDVV